MMKCSGNGGMPGCNGSGVLDPECHIHHVDTLSPNSLNSNIISASYMPKASS